jgi:glucose-6-phosphate isomerase
MSLSKTIVSKITAADGRSLVTQSVGGCLEERIGAAGISSASLEHWLDRLETPLAELKETCAKGALEHFTILDRDDDIQAAEAALAALSEHVQTIVFLGTGGSSLGGQTLAQLGGWNIPGTADAAQRKRPRTRFLDNLDAATLDACLAGLDLASTGFIVTSKSGGTPETLAQAVAALGAMREAGLSDRIPRHVLAVSDPAVAGKSNPLRNLCSALAIPVLDHPPGIGGRFSVLSVVGLLPALARGLDVRALRRGAKAGLNSLTSADMPDVAPAAIGAAISVALARECGIEISVMLPYADRLQRFGAWYVQLWAESLGKGGQGTTPLACLGPLDQHSQLQLFMDGPKQHLINVVRTAPVAGARPLAADLARLAGIAYLDGRTVGDLVAAQSQAVPEALGRAGRPVRTLDLDRLDETAVGALLMHMMLETMLAAKLFQVDAFDQPAVELAKVLTRERLAAKG